jgi:hypothetical protein
MLLFFFLKTKAGVTILFVNIIPPINPHFLIELVLKSVPIKLLQLFNLLHPVPRTNVESVLNAVRITFCVFRVNMHSVILVGMAAFPRKFAKVEFALCAFTTLAGVEFRLLPFLAFVVNPFSMIINIFL